MDNKQVAKEIEELKRELKEVSVKSHEEVPAGASFSELLKYLAEERARTNRTLEAITQRMKALEDMVSAIDLSNQADDYAATASKEIPLSGVDAKLINFVQTKGMACAEEVKAFMNYKGNNAACARLNNLHRLGLLDRLQLGHKVYYKYDAGKAINTLIVSPP
jgi:cell division septum initiation protein DivIVA